MFIVAGLGNPDNEGYAENRHNVGFMAVDELVRRHNFSSFRKKFDALVSQGQIDGEDIIIIKPQTYMNLSGISLQKASHFYKITPENVIVIHDDLDLPTGKIKAKKGGGHGGHNGLKSIDSQLGTKEYYRIRIGIGRPENSNLVSNYVLSNFAKSEKEIIENALKAVVDSFSSMLKNDTGAFGTMIAKKLQPEIKKEKTPKKDITPNQSEEKDNIMKQAFEKALNLFKK